MPTDSQKFLARNRAPRVQIAYDVELYGAEKSVQLPFVMGVMADLSGKSQASLPAIDDRKFLEIDIDNFDARMREMKPRAAFSVPNTLSGEGNLSVDLTFERMDDFSPAAVAQKIEPLRKLLEARTQLSNLMTYMDGKAGAEELIGKLLGDTAAFTTLAGVAAGDDAGREAALDALRHVAPEVASKQSDHTANALASLRDAAPPAAEVEDSGADALASLRAVEIPADASQADDTADALAALRSAAPEVAVSEMDGTADALDALRAAAPGETDLPDERADALDALRNLPDTAATAPTAEAGTALDALRAAGEAVDAAAAAEEDPLDALRSLDLPEESPGPDGSAVALDSLRDIEVEEPMAADDLDAALDALTAMAETAVESDGAPDEAAAALDALRAVPVETVAAPEDDGAAALDALRDLDMPEAAEADDPLAALRDLERPEGSVELSEAEDPLASLGDTAEPDEVGDELDDLDALLAEREAGPDATDDLAELDALLADSDEPETTADQADGLEDLDSLLDEPAELQADELDGLIGGSAEADADTAEDSTDPGAPFGVITAPKPEREESNEFRIAILGDFSGRASRGELEIGEALGARKAIKFDIDEIDRVIARFQTTLTLPIGADGAAVEVPLASLDDLHPDELYENVAVFDELRALRQRLKTGKGLDATIAEMQQWGAEFGDKPVGARGRGKGAAVPADRRLSDFQRLIGDAGGAQAGPSAADALMQRVVGPHVVAAPDPRQESMIAAVDEALSSAMRAILHHPDFQTVEALWRSLDLLARRVETDAKLRIVLYDVSAEEWAADLSAQEDLAESGLYALLAEGEAPFSAVFGLYTLEETPPHAELLARMAKISAHLEAPFVTAIGAGFLETPLKDRHPLTTKAWEAMRDCPEARYVGLAAPRFLLRLPYGKRTEPIDPFSFEEFTEREGLKGMLWANPAVLVAVLLAATAKGGVRSMSLGKIMSLGDMPFHYVTDRYGDQVALPCTERMITTRKAAEIVARGFMPVVSMQGRPELRLASFQGLGHGELMGPWSGAEPVAAGEAGPDPAVAMDVNAGSDQPDADQDHMLDGSGADDDGLADGGDDDDLDALLAGFGDDDAGIGGDDETDADLAALLEDL